MERPGGRALSIDAPREVSKSTAAVPKRPRLALAASASADITLDRPTGRTPKTDTRYGQRPLGYPADMDFPPPMSGVDWNMHAPEGNGEQSGRDQGIVAATPSGGQAAGNRANAPPYCESHRC